MHTFVRDDSTVSGMAINLQRIGGYQENYPPADENELFQDRPFLQQALMC